MVKTRNAETLALDTTQQKKVAKETKKVKKQLEQGTLTIKETHKDAKIQVEEGRGLIYIGHIPHGFYEEEMRDYFKQFGKVTNVKVCRSRKTGNSKGFGYVEFAQPDVAKIAADTMNNYLMFKKRVVTEYVPYEKRPKHLFHGKSSSQNQTSVKSRRGKEKHTKNRVLDEKTLTKKNKSTLKRLSSKIKKLKDLGIQCKVSPIALETVSLKPQKKSEVKVKKSDKLLIKKFEAPQNLSDNDSEETFKMPLTKSKSRSKNPSQKSLTSPKSNRAILTKSLDSVKTLISTGNVTDQLDEETQTPPIVELRSRSQRAVKKGGIKKSQKVKKENRLNLNSETVKKIARELIRKKGNPLVNVISNKKSPKKSKK